MVIVWYGMVWYGMVWYGTLGNAFGTFAGLSLGSFCLKKIAGY